MTVAERRDAWARRIEQFESSGQKKAPWCRANDIDSKALSRWMKKLSSEKELKDVKPQRFILAETTVEKQVCVGVRIKIGGATIEVDSDFNKDALANVIQIVSCVC